MARFENQKQIQGSDKEMNVLHVKPGVSFSVIAPGGFVILSALQRTCILESTDLTVTSGCDGEHSGPNDPHHRGEAYDVRSHDFDPVKKQAVLQTCLRMLPEDRFFGFIESPGTDNEHFHFQVKKGTTFP
jgi:hypothetical protein